MTYKTAGTYLKKVASTPSAVAEQALADLDLIQISNESTQIDAEVVARTAQDRKVTIRVEKICDNICDVDVRVGNSETRVSVPPFSKKSARSWLRPRRRKPRTMAGPAFLRRLGPT